MVNCNVNYLHCTSVAFSICLAIYSLCFVFLLPFVVGIPLSITSLVFSLRFWDRGSKQTFGLSFASYVMIWHPCGPRVFLHFALSWVCWELWHLRSDIAKLDMSLGNRALPALKIARNSRWLKLLWTYFWQEYTGQKILCTGQRWITSYHSTWRDALILCLDSLRRNGGGETCSLTKLYWEKHTVY